jgi:dipeptidyl-peptidase-4
MIFINRRAIVLLLVAGAATTGAQTPTPARLTLERIFASPEFFGERFGPARWLASGDAYTTLEAGANGGADIVRYDAATGVRTVLVPAARLTP